MARAARENVTHKSASVVPRLSEFSYDHAWPSVPGWYAVKWWRAGGPSEYFVVEVHPFGETFRMFATDGNFTQKQAKEAGYSIGPLLFRLEDGDA